jgi:hypothetical protein
MFESLDQQPQAKAEDSYDYETADHDCERASQGIGAPAAYLRFAQNPEQNCRISRLLWAEFTLDAGLI